MWTSLKLIQWTAGFFEKKGIPNPRLDAELLLAHALRCQRIDLYTHHEKKIGEKDLARFKPLVERRARREPLQYILGETEFWGLKIKVTPDVLIPRPETELLVEEAMTRFKVQGLSRPAILDIGTGSGCIAVALAKNLPGAQIVATELSKEAASVARDNIKRHGFEDRIEIILSDIAPWRQFEVQGRRFNLIISNPPYIPTRDLQTLQDEVKDFEPLKALDGGSDGLTVIRRILREAPEYLEPDGLLILEIGEGEADSLRREWQIFFPLKLQGFRKDYAGIERTLIAQRV